MVTSTEEGLSWMSQRCKSLKLLASGKYSIEMKILEPTSYAGRRKLGVYDIGDIKVNRVVLKKGDVIQFDAEKPVMEKAVEPDVFSNLKNVCVIPPSHSSRNCHRTEKPASTKRRVGGSCRTIRWGRRRA